MHERERERETETPAGLASSSFSSHPANNGHPFCPFPLDLNGATYARGRRAAAVAGRLAARIGRRSVEDIDRLACFLLASRVACTGLAVASFAIGPPLTKNTLVAEAFVALKAAAFLAMFLCPMLMLLHSAELRQWQCRLPLAPGDHFSYPLVFFEWVFAIVYWGSGSAALGVLTVDSFTQICVGEHQGICWRYNVACALVLLLGVVTAANAVVLSLLVLLFGH